MFIWPDASDRTFRDAPKDFLVEKLLKAVKHAAQWTHVNFIVLPPAFISKKRGNYVSVDHDGFLLYLKEHNQAECDQDNVVCQ